MDFPFTTMDLPKLGKGQETERRLMTKLVNKQRGRDTADGFSRRSRELLREQEDVNFGLAPIPRVFKPKPKPKKPKKIPCKHLISPNCGKYFGQRGNYIISYRKTK
jgi:hypothetical protein